MLYWPVMTHLKFKFLEKIHKNKLLITNILWLYGPQVHSLKGILRGVWHALYKEWVEDLHFQIVNAHDLLAYLFE
jgi:hypothetical protein